MHILRHWFESTPINVGWFLVLACLSMVMISCEQDAIDIPNGALEEQVVDLQGTWQVARATLNGRDITGRFDFSQIKLTLSMNPLPSDFKLETGFAPFPILTDGTWTFNDLAYPTALIMRTVELERVIDLAMPPISGDQKFSLSFTLGCPDNIYTYEFIRQ